MLSSGLAKRIGRLEAQVQRLWDGEPQVPRSQRHSVLCELTQLDDRLTRLALVSRCRPDHAGRGEERVELDLQRLEREIGRLSREWSPSIPTAAVAA